MSNKPTTELEWIEAAEEVVSDAKDAAKSGDKATMRKARQACSAFISSTTLQCPQEVVDTVAGVQVQLSHLIVAEDIGSIAQRTVQFNAFLQDIERIAARADKAADLISLSSAKKLVDNVTGIVADLGTIRQMVNEGPKEAIEEIMDRLTQIQTDFNNLAGSK